MISSVLALAASCALAWPAAPPQAGPEGFATKESRGITLHYSLEMRPQDAEALLSTLATTRDALRVGLGIGLVHDPVVQVRQRANSRRAYFTDAEEKIFFDFPGPMYFVGLQYADPKVLRYAIPSFIQIWLYRCLSSTAGLDPRVLESLVDYARYLMDVEVARATKAALPAAPAGLGVAWQQLELLYPGTTVFILNFLSTQKVPAHLLGTVLRETAINATEDPQVAKIFDLITPPEPIFAPTELEPGPLVNPALPLRPGRLALFNGTPILDTESEPIPVLDRIADFDHVFEMVALLTPDARIVNEPPAVRGVPLWPLYFEFRPRVLKARDNLDYTLVLREFLARFKDRAVALRQTPALPVLPGSPLWNSVYGLGFARKGDRVFVSKVTPDTEPAKAGLAPGVEVLTVDGRPATRVHDLLAQFIEVFDSCPSPQRARAAALDQLLTGAPGSPCVLELDDPAATDPTKRRRTVTFTRGLPPYPKPVPLTVEHELRASDQVGVIKVRQFMGDALQRFAAAIEDLTKQGAKAVVIDLRGNEGVRDPRNPASLSLAMLARLLPPNAGKLVIGSVVNRDRSRFDAVQSKEITAAPTPAATSFVGPVAVLTDAWTGSEAELFVLGFQLAKRGLVVGQTTAGSVSMPMEPQSWQALTRSRLELNFAANVIVRPNDQPLQTIGITPQEEVLPDPADLRTGRDTALERAIQLLLPHP